MPAMNHGLSISMPLPWDTLHRNVPQMHRTPALHQLDLLPSRYHADLASPSPEQTSADSSAHCRSCASSNVAHQSLDTLPQGLPRNPKHHRQWPASGLTQASLLQRQQHCSPALFRFPDTLFNRHKMLLTATVHADDDQTAQSCTETSELITLF